MAEPLRSPRLRFVSQELGDDRRWRQVEPRAELLLNTAAGHIRFAHLNAVELATLLAEGSEVLRKMLRKQVERG